MTIYLLNQISLKEEENEKLEKEINELKKELSSIKMGISRQEKEFKALQKHNAELKEARINLIQNRRQLKSKKRKTCFIATILTGVCALSLMLANFFTISALVVASSLVVTPICYRIATSRLRQRIKNQSLSKIDAEMERCQEDLLCIDNEWSHQVAKCHDLEDKIDSNKTTMSINNDHIRILKSKVELNSSRQEESQTTKDAPKIYKKTI